MIEVNSVSYAYPGSSSLALSSASLNVAPGEILALVGANGSGKSTLAQMLNGGILPDAGSVYIDGVDASEGWRAARAVGFVRQDPSRMVVSSEVLDEVMFGPLNLGQIPSDARAKAFSALENVSARELADRLTHELSGGQLQRVCIADVLAMDPSYIVFDEAFCQLDDASHEALFRVVERLAEKGVGVVLVTHDAREIACADTVCVLDGGRVAWTGSSDAFALVADRYETGPAADEIRRAYDDAPAASDVAGGVLSLEHATFSYGEGDVLEDASLELEPGALTLVTGPSGSGKSTLARLLCGLDAPDAGRVLLGGVPVAAGRVGYCMQRSQDMLVGSTVLEDVALGPAAQGLPPREVDGRARAALDLFRVPQDLYGRAPLSLSGGQRRRVALAGIAAMRTGAYVFDEPSIGLDASGVLELVACVSSLVKAGAAVCVMAHDTRVWAPLADASYVLSGRRLAKAGACG